MWRSLGVLICLSWAAAQAQVLVVPSEAVEKLIVRRVPAELPERARELGIRGVVRFTFQVSPEGRVERAELISGHPLLVEAARKALLQYRFRVPRAGGRPARWRSTIAIPVPEPGAEPLPPGIAQAGCRGRARPGSCAGERA